jgi:AraC-like DNA-binding protein
MASDVPQRIIDDLEDIFRRRDSFSARFGRDIDIGRGMETRTDPREYYWDGMKRGADPAHPNIIFQYCLAGFGIYESGGVKTRVLPGHAFTSVNPTQHCYYLPHDSPSWTFFWFGLHHPYAVARMHAVVKQSGPVMKIPTDSLLFSKSVQFFENVCRNRYRDAQSQELGLFDFMLEYERAASAQQYSTPARERMLAETRDWVLQRITRALSVDELAEQHGKSRSHFSHDFKTATGLSPANFITQVRLQEVTRRLIDTNDKLDKIARETGFADANHLCKVFRRSFRLSPGAYRKQMK